MSAILLCWYALGVSTVAWTCQDPEQDDLHLGELVGLLAFWPLVFLSGLATLIPAGVGSFVVWRQE